MAAPPPSAMPVPPPPPLPPVAPIRADTRATAHAPDGGGPGAAKNVKHDFQGAGVGWRAQPRPRSPEAEQYFRQATLDAEAGKVDSAIALLRHALQLAPGDPEIAALLGRLAFRDRNLPQK
jgi:Flp pilus assembly protein TadD